MKPIGEGVHLTGHLRLLLINSVQRSDHNYAINRLVLYLARNLSTTGTIVPVAQVHGARPPPCY